MFSNILQRSKRFLVSCIRYAIYIILFMPTGFLHALGSSSNSARDSAAVIIEKTTWIDVVKISVLLSFMFMVFFQDADLLGWIGIDAKKHAEGKKRLYALVGLAFCTLVGYWSYLDSGILFGLASFLLLFGAMAVDVVFIDISEFIDLSTYAKKLYGICLILSALVACSFGYYVFMSGVFQGNVFKKLFLVVFISSLFMFYYRALLPRNFVYSEDEFAFANVKNSYIFVLFLIAFRTFCYDVMYVPSGSMTPTLRIADLVVVKRAHYGLGQEMMWPIGRICPWLPTCDNNPIKRNDIIVWTQDNFGLVESLVKRVVAVEGDTFYVDNNHIVLNGQKLEWEDLNIVRSVNDSVTAIIVSYHYEIGPDGTKRLIQNDSKKYVYSDTAIRTVPQGCIVVIGDNRTKGGSHDCRDPSKFPPIGKVRVIGYPKYVLLSSDFWKKWDRDASWSEVILTIPLRVVSYIKHINPARCLKKIQ